jgi:UDP-3-O-[3-hydroxymyristoyl] glucosamine N-acyltransferase
MATLEQLVLACGAQLEGGKSEQVINSAANIDGAQADQITFIACLKYGHKLATTAAGAVIVPRSLPNDPTLPATALLRVDDPEISFINCLNLLYPVRSSHHAVSPDASIDPSARLDPSISVAAHASIGPDSVVGKRCRIGAGCRIGADVTIGNDCVLHPNVVLYDGVSIGDRVVIHAGTVIGSDGYGYKFRNGVHVKFPQVGTVTIESDVEIGANTCIDRAALGTTRIGAGTKIDNQVHVAHNVQIGRGALLLGQVGVGGSTVIEDYAILASQCGIADHVTVGRGAIISAQSGVTKDVAAKEHVMGFPAASRKEALREMAALRRIASVHKEVDELLKLLPNLRTLALEKQS